LYIDNDVGVENATLIFRVMEFYPGRLLSQKVFACVMTVFVCFECWWWETSAVWRNWSAFIWDGITCLQQNMLLLHMCCWFLTLIVLMWRIGWAH